MDQLEDYKQRILAHALPQIAFDGWCDATLRKAAVEAGIEPDYLRILFPNGPVDAIAWHSRQADAAMAAHLQTLKLQELPVPLRVKEAVMWRLREYAPQREAIRQALTVLSFPLHAATASKLLYHTVDTIWFETGDRSTDYNFYTKRLTLAAIYSATLPIWLDDASDNLAETEAFFDRRLKEVGRFGKSKKQLLQGLEGFITSPNGRGRKMHSIFRVRV